VTTTGRGAFLKRSDPSHATSDQGLVSVIVPHYNDVQSLGLSLRSLQAQRYRPIEIIVVDDGSAEPVYVAAAQCCEGVAQLVRMSHGGPAAARNRGASVANGRILVFCEADAVYPPDYVGSIVAPIERCQDGTVVAASNVGRRVLEETSTWGHRYAHVLYAAVDDAIRRGLRRTGAWAYDTRWFLASGGYREDLLVGEDIDLVERVVESGLKVGYGGDVPFEHREPASLRNLFRRAYRSGVTSRFRRPLLVFLILAVVLLVGAWRVAGFGPTVGCTVLAMAVAMLADPTWRLVIGFSTRSGSIGDMAVATAGRLVWIAGYVSGAVIKR